MSEKELCLYTRRQKYAAKKKGEKYYYLARKQNGKWILLFEHCTDSTNPPQQPQYRHNLR